MSPLATRVVSALTAVPSGLSLVDLAAVAYRGCRVPDHFEASLRATMNSARVELAARGLEIRREMPVYQPGGRYYLCELGAERRVRPGWEIGGKYTVRRKQTWRVTSSCPRGGRGSAVSRPETR